MKVSLENNFWSFTIQDFTGNKDKDTVVYHVLNPPIRARYIRFRPEDWYEHISMRVELYGCREGTCKFLSSGSCLFFLLLLFKRNLYPYDKQKLNCLQYIMPKLNSNNE